MIGFKGSLVELFLSCGIAAIRKPIGTIGSLDKTKTHIIAVIIINDDPYDLLLTIYQFLCFILPHQESASLLKEND